MEQNNNQNGSNQPRKSNNKNLIIAGIAIIVVIALAIIIPHLKHAGSNSAPVDTSTSDAAGTSSTGDTAASNTAWNDLFQKYDGKIVVFGADCNTTPHLLQKVPAGSTVLLMNNGAVSHTITASGAPYVIGAYHYKTVVVNGPAATVLDCDNHASVGAITVQ